MINIKHLLKVSSVWISIIYTICYTGVAVYPPVRGMFMKYSLHATVGLSSDYFGIGYFISGLIVWNVVVLFSVGFFAYLFNTFKK